MRRLLSATALLVSAAAPVLAQGGMTMAAPPAGRISAQPSPRASSTLTLTTGVRGAPTMKVAVNYGQPWARGRVVEGGLIPNGSVWRLGANEATAFTTDVNLRIGALSVPKGSYTLFTLWSPAAGMQLIVNKETGQWGTDYKQPSDLGRVPMTARTLADTRDALSITLEPAAATATPAGGTIRITWGKSEFSVPFTVMP
jgi:hypothetical protein